MVYRGKEKHIKILKGSRFAKLTQLLKKQVFKKFKKRKSSSRF